jgi:hypothetical protein
MLRQPPSEKFGFPRPEDEHSAGISVSIERFMKRDRAPPEFGPQPPDSLTNTIQSVDVFINLVLEEELVLSAVSPYNDRAHVDGLDQPISFDVLQPVLVGLSVESTRFAGFLRPLF